ncbi:helix-turn-helix domain-containing protein [Actinomadura sp. LD22]|uniref:Helix-turn-helix domain-containing protein n=1 Tax=Actinomadura physcomitrii TaxID=2650748 RepID=A0A6I4MDP8_9ACTN|nr:helix-turn-helix transcriptional regulator [Actinomadura physcomitrii]MWA02334.1 helix-turn-helix domain-containing protein [Actinomadura physcomitrii]MWA03094.1 helix-turn-helix domain-containing protein [Actinomadura physcomitrii]
MTTFGQKLRQLMDERRLSQRKLAALVPCNDGYLSRVARDLRTPAREIAERLDELLDADGALTELVPEKRTPAADDVLELAAWLEETNVGDGAVDYLGTAIRRLAHDYPRQPPLAVLQEAQTLQSRVAEILRSGRQRLAQTRDLLSISAELFALINLLAGDVGRYRLADAYGYGAWTCAQEADSDTARALVLCAQSKTARWEGRYADAAELAGRGFHLAPAGGRGRVLLAVSEAAALQARGDIAAANEAMRRAEDARDTCSAADERADAWSCTRARQATYALQVGLGARDPADMLRSVAHADDAWADGDQWVYGTWAQVRIGAALAHVMTGEPDGAAEELKEVFDLGADYRVVTIIGRMGEIERRLGHSRYKGDPCAAELREKIRAFRAGSLEHKALTAVEAP